MDNLSKQVSQQAARPTDPLMARMKVVPALCLDLDGTVRITISGKPFAEHGEDYQLNPGIEEKIMAYKEKGYIVLGFTNQGGVAHGFKQITDVRDESMFMMSLFKQNPFAYIYAAHNDAAGKVFPFNYRSLLRKPDIGMLAIAEAHAWEAGFVIDWNNSLFVGDREEDRLCAERACIPYLHIDDFLKQ